MMLLFCLEINRKTKLTNLQLGIFLMIFVCAVKRRSKIKYFYTYWIILVWILPKKKYNSFMFKMFGYSLKFKKNVEIFNILSHLVD